MDITLSRRLKNYKPTRFKAPGSIYKPRFADAAVYFINHLKHTDGRWWGKPFDLLDWQERIIRDIFGVVRAHDECRQFKRAYIEIPKKQGKSELAAAVALLLTCADLERGGEIYGCASNRQQAAIIFDVAVEMIDQFPQLKVHMKLYPWQKKLIFKPLNSFYQVLASDAYSKHGLNAHGIIFDELHALRDRKFFDVMTRGSGDAREQPLQFIITTAGHDRNSIGWEMHQYASDVLEGRKVDKHFYPVIYAAKEDDDWTDEEVWKRVNPSLGITVSMETMRYAFEDAKLNIVNENTFRQLRLNQWVKQSNRYINMEKWDLCAFPIDIESLAGRECYGGLDLSTTTDITAFVLVFPPSDDGDKFVILPFFWLPEEALHYRVRRDHVPYDLWQGEGLLHTTEGEVVNYSFVEKFITELGQKYDIREIAYDPWNSVEITQNLRGEGFTVIDYRQGYQTMSPATKEFHRMVLEKKIAHGGNRVLRWMADNLAVDIDASGNVKPSKEKASERIDGIVAAIMALDRAVRQMNQGSVYNKRDMYAYGADGWITG